MEYNEFRAMNTSIQVYAEGSRKAASQGFAEVRRLVAESELRFSRFTPDSELSQMNQSQSGWIYVSPDMYDLLDQALELYDLTGGLFDPSILGALKDAGYDRSMDDIRTFSSLPARPDHPWLRPIFRAIRLDLERCAVYKPAGLQIDLGGLAKGWIAEKAGNLLAKYTPAGLVNAGGDMFISGLPKGKSAWQVLLEDPRDATRSAAQLSVGPGGVATSTITKRRWIQGDQLRHHIIDPRSGQSSDGSWLSVTVVARHAAQAEAFAKALLIAGPQGAPLIAARNPDIRFLAIQADGIVIGIETSKEILYVDQSF